MRSRLAVHQRASVGLRLLALGLAAAALAPACRHDDGPVPMASGSPSPTSSPSASATPSASPSPSMSASASPSRSPLRSASPSVRPTARGTVLTTSGAYLTRSEDENLTTPDPENGCEVHDPDLTSVRCGIVAMAGGTATWITGRERTTLPGAPEPRVVVRLYQRLANGDDSLVWVGYGDPGQWAEVAVLVGSLTGQTRDTLLVAPTFQGSGTLRGYDLVVWRAGQRFMNLLGHHPEEPKARIFVRRAYVAFYGADYSDGAPNCCPNYFTHDRVRWDGTRFRREQLARVRAASVPSS